MKVQKEDTNRNRVYCPVCGNEWYIDDEDEYINENSSNNTDFEYELARFCSGGDLPESGLSDDEDEFDEDDYDDEDEDDDF
jgi:hypothetical protein